MPFKKNTAVTGFPLVFIKASDGSALTSGTPAGYVTKDGGTQASLTNTPAHEGNGQWSVDLTAGEMNGDVIGLLFTLSTAIPVHFTIKTETKLVSDLNDVSTADVNAQCDTAISDAGLTAAGIADAVWDEATSGHTTDDTFGDLVQNGPTGEYPSVSAIGDEVAAEMAAMGLDHLVSAAVTSSDVTNGSIVARLVSKSGTPAWSSYNNVTDSLEAIRDRVDELTPGVVGSGTGSVQCVYTLTDTDGVTPVADADVWVTSDADGRITIASGRTDQNGQVTFWLDPGIIYVWRQKSGWNGTNPDIERVVAP